MKFLFLLVAAASATNSCWDKDGAAMDAQEVPVAVTEADCTGDLLQWAEAWVAPEVVEEKVDCDAGWDEIKDDCSPCANMGACTKQSADADSVEVDADAEDPEDCAAALALVGDAYTGACAFMVAGFSCENDDDAFTAIKMDYDDMDGDCTEAAMVKAAPCAAYSECKGYKDLVKAAGDAAAEESPASILALGASLVLMLL